MKKIYFLAAALAATLGASAAPQSTVLLSEDFSKFTAGSETEPAAEIEYENSYYIPASYTSAPGWSGGGIHPAGGCVAVMPYEYYDEYYDETTSREGTINTPLFNLGGTAILTFKAKAVPGYEAELWACICDPDYGPGDDELEAALTDQWQTFTLTATSGSLEDPNYFQIQAYEGAMLIDDVTIEFKRDRIATPEVNPAVNLSATSFKASWEAVDGAAGYRLTVVCTANDPNGQTGSISEGFDGIQVGADGKTIAGGIPQGWIISNATATTEEANVASAPVALVIGQTGDIVESPRTPEPLSKLSFWVKPSKFSDSDYPSMLKVEIHHSSNDRWEHIANLPYSYLTREGAPYVVPAATLGDDSDALRLSLAQKGEVEFYIDNVEMTYANRGITTRPVDALELTDTEYVMTGINPANDYSYYVTAFDGDLVSTPSYMAWVDGLVGLSVESLGATNVQSTSFTATWGALGHAQNYKVESFCLTDASEDVAGAVVLEESFDGITEGTLQNPGYDFVSPMDFSDRGWTRTGWCATQPRWIEGMAGSQGTSWIGQAGLVFSPRLDLSCNAGQGFDVEATVLTTVAGFQNNSGETETEGVFVMVLKNHTDSQPLAYALIDAPAAGTHTEKVHIATAPSMDLSDVIVAFMSKSGQTFYVDHVKITQDLKKGETLSAPYAISNTAETSLHFNNLTAGSDYAFRVTASATRNYENYLSNPSELFRVGTAAGISTPSASATGVRVYTTPGAIVVEADDTVGTAIYDLYGHHVATTRGTAAVSVAPGIYVVAIDTQAVKVAVK